MKFLKIVSALQISQSPVIFKVKEKQINEYNNHNWKRKINKKRSKQYVLMYVEYTRKVSCSVWFYLLVYTYVGEGGGGIVLSFRISLKISAQLS